MNEQDIKNRIMNDLPGGMHLQDIKKYLTGNKIEHSYCKEEQTLYAIIRKCGGSFWVEKNLQIIITLDQQDTLLSITIFPVFTGP